MNSFKNISIKEESPEIKCAVSHLFLLLRKSISLVLLSSAPSLIFFTQFLEKPFLFMVLFCHILLLPCLLFFFLLFFFPFFHCLYLQACGNTLRGKDTQNQQKHLQIFHRFCCVQGLFFSLFIFVPYFENFTIKTELFYQNTAEKKRSPCALERLLSLQLRGPAHTSQPLS